jgi:hypothetical protein
MGLEVFVFAKFAQLGAVEDWRLVETFTAVTRGPAGSALPFVGSGTCGSLTAFIGSGSCSIFC